MVLIDLRKRAGLSGHNYESFRQEPAREYITIFYNKNILLHSSIFLYAKTLFFIPSERRFLLDHPTLLPGRLPTTLQTSRQSLARRLDQVPTMRHHSCVPTVASGKAERTKVKSTIKGSILEFIGWRIDESYAFPKKQFQAIHYEPQAGWCQQKFLHQ